jgi:hypothetical protein
LPVWTYKYVCNRPGPPTPNRGEKKEEKTEGRNPNDFFGIPLCAVAKSKRGGISIPSSLMTFRPAVSIYKAYCYYQIDELKRCTPTSDYSFRQDPTELAIYIRQQQQK